MHKVAFLSLGLLLAASSPGHAERLRADVVRFHQAAPALAGQAILVQSADPALADSLAFKSYANALGERLAKQGARPAKDAASAQLIAVLSYSSSLRPAGPARSPFSIGIGVGGGSSNVGVNVGTSVPIGKAKTRELRATQVTVQLKRAGDGQTLWEGRATTEGRDSPAYAETAVIPQLMDAMFAVYPGAQGKTERWRAPRS
jgi:hypothetical protein